MMPVMKRLLLVTVALIALAGSPTASALHPKGTPPPGGWNPDLGLTFGGGGAWSFSPVLKHGFVPSLEASFFKRIRRPLSFWSSLLLRVPIAEGGTGFIPGVEAGLNLMFFNIGAGYGVGIGDNLADHQMNIFVGAGLPLYTRKKNRLFYMQVYYRPIFNFAQGEMFVSHELGILFKWMIMFTRKEKLP